MEAKNKRVFNYSISPLKWTQKPTDLQFGKITNSKKDFESTIGEFSELITAPHSHTWWGATFNGNVSDNNWNNQSIIGLDFDDGKNSVEEVVQFFEPYGITPNLYYYTFSDSPELRKFRFVLFFDEPIKDLKTFKSIFAVLLYNLSIDKKCINPSRMFLGGTGTVILNEEPICLQSFIHLLNIDSIIGNEEKAETLLSYYKSSAFVTNKSNAISSDVKMNFEAERNNVKVWDALLSRDIKLHHGELFGLASNLKYVRGGLKKLELEMREFNLLYPESYSKNNFLIIKAIRKYNYYPMPISTFSSYKEDADLENLLYVIQKRGKIKKLFSVKKYEFEDAETLLREKFDIALKDQESKKIYIFKVATAIGKTEMLTNVEKCIIAFPTNNLKNEVGSRMKVENIISPDPIVFSDYSINNRIHSLFYVGLKKEAMKIIYAVAQGGFTKDVGDIELAKKFIKDLESCSNPNITVLNTHKRLLYSEELNHKTIIFDEDPLKDIAETKSTSIREITGFSYLFPPMREVSEHLHSLADGIYDTLQYGLDMDLLVSSTAKLCGGESNIFEFFYSDFFIKEGDKIQYVKKLFLPEEKIIIMSATINIEIYKKLYPNREFEVCDISNINGKGTLNQYTRFSYSRESLKKDSEIIKQIVGTMPVITFLKLKDIFQNPVIDMHFGNCCGYDTLSGKDLAVVGTPHIHNSYYFLLARCMDVNFYYTDSKFRVQKIKYNGFEFSFNCFENEELRKIQFATIERDLIQAVGRARILRNNCIVHLFSNFPLYLTDEFINNKNKKHLS